MERRTIINWEEGLEMVLFLKIKIGAFGEVRKCIHRQTGDMRAVKILRKDFISGDEKKRFFSEIEILKRMVKHIKK